MAERSAACAGYAKDKCLDKPLWDLFEPARELGDTLVRPCLLASLASHLTVPAPGKGVKAVCGAAPGAVRA